MLARFARRSLLTLAALLGVGLVTSAAHADVPRVYVGVYLHDVSTFDQKNGVFDVDADVWAKWRGDFDPARLHVANGARVELQPLGRDSDGAWHSARWRLRGTLRGEFPLHRFPFDRQTLAVVLELPAHEGQLIPDLAASGMARTFSITDWHYEPEFRPARTTRAFRSDLGHLAFEGQAAQVDRVAFEVALERPIRPVVLKLFLPLFIVALVVLCSLFVHPDSLQPRLTMSVTGMVACFAFQFSVSDVLPAVAYLTLADALFTVVYLVSTMCVVAAVVSYRLHRGGRLRQLAFFQRGVFSGLPLTALGLIWAAVPDALPVPASAPAPVPALSRPASARDVVRIGTTGNLRVASSAAGVAAYWPLVHDDPQAGPVPLLVEEAPTVDSRALRFLAGGELEVTWRLRDGARWSDGRLVTVADLALPLVASPDEHLVGWRALDARTLVLRWSDRLSRALAPPTLWPAHVVGDLYRQQGYAAVRTHLGRTGVPSTGPYHIASHDDDRLVALANPHFLGAPPSIPRVEILRYPDRDALLRAFLAGEVDITAPNDLSPQHLDQVAQHHPGRVHEGPSANFVFLHPNLEHPLLARPEVRRAIVQAIDRQRLVTQVFGDASRVAHVPVGDRLPAGVAPIAHDPDAARAALAQAGATGAVIPLAYAQSTPPELVELLTADLAAVGLTLRPEPVRSTWPLWRDGGHPGLVLHTLRGARDAPPQQWWNLPQDNGRYPSTARNVAYTDAVHALVQREQRALYPERRDQLRDALFAAWSQALPSIPLAFTDERLLANPRLQGWHRPPESPFGLGLERWHFTPWPQGLLE